MAIPWRFCTAVLPPGVTCWIAEQAGEAAMSLLTHQRAMHGPVIQVSWLQQAKQIALFINCKGSVWISLSIIKHCSLSQQDQWLISSDFCKTWNNGNSPCDFFVAASDKILCKHIKETNRKHLRCLSMLKFYYFWDLKRLRKHHWTLFHTYSWKGNIIKPGQITLNTNYHVKYVKERNTGDVGRIIRREGRNNCTCDCGVLGEFFRG